METLKDLSSVEQKNDAQINSTEVQQNQVKVKPLQAVKEESKEPENKQDELQNVSQEEKKQVSTYPNNENSNQHNNLDPTNQANQEVIVQRQDIPVALQQNENDNENEKDGESQPIRQDVEILRPINQEQDRRANAAASDLISVNIGEVPLAQINEELAQEPLDTQVQNQVIEAVVRNSNMTPLQNSNLNTNQNQQEVYASVNRERTGGGVTSIGIMEDSPMHQGQRNGGGNIAANILLQRQTADQIDAEIDMVHREEQIVMHHQSVNNNGDRNIFQMHMASEKKELVSNQNKIGTTDLAQNNINQVGGLVWGGHPEHTVSGQTLCEEVKQKPMPGQERQTSEGNESLELINHFMEVDALFWDRDSHGLFDYEFKHLKLGHLQTVGCSILARENYLLKTVIPRLGTPDHYHMLLTIVYKAGCYWVFHKQSLLGKDGNEVDGAVGGGLDDKFNHFDQAWQIVRLQNQKIGKLTTAEQIQDRTVRLKDVRDSVKVTEGDMLKFGRVRFRIKKLVIEKQKNANQNGNNSDLLLNRIDSEFQELNEREIMQKNLVSQLAPRGSRTTQVGGQEEFQIADTQVLQTMMSGRNSIEGNMDQILRLHSSENYSFDCNKNQNDKLEQQIENAEMKGEKDLSGGKDAENRICRICLSEEEFPEHELISPCKCAGSMHYIGLSCLKEWLEGKRHCKETPHVNSYIWKNLECDICKEPFKDTFIGKDGRELSLLNYVVHDYSENYMIIESVTQTTSKTIHVINFDSKDNIKVGRAQLAEVRITDISVSRHHSNLILNEDGSVSVTDNYSKFGTLKLLRHPMPIRAEKDEVVYLQVGRCTLALSSRSRFSWWQKLNCCYLQSKKRRQQVENFLHYEESAKEFPQEFIKMFGGLYHKNLLLKQSRLNLTGQLNFATTPNEMVAMSQTNQMVNLDQIRASGGVANTVDGQLMNNAQGFHMGGGQTFDATSNIQGDQRQNGLNNSNIQATNNAAYQPYNLNPATNGNTQLDHTSNVGPALQQINDRSQDEENQQQAAILIGDQSLVRQDSLSAEEESVEGNPIDQRTQSQLRPGVRGLRGNRQGPSRESVTDFREEANLQQSVEGDGLGVSSSNLITMPNQQAIQPLSSVTNNASGAQQNNINRQSETMIRQQSVDFNLSVSRENEPPQIGQQQQTNAAVNQDYHQSNGNNDRLSQNVQTTNSVQIGGQPNQSHNFGRNTQSMPPNNANAEGQQQRMEQAPPRNSTQLFSDGSPTRIGIDPTLLLSPSAAEGQGQDMLNIDQSSGTQIFQTPLNSYPPPNPNQTQPQQQQSYLVTSQANMTTQDRQTRRRQLDTTVPPASNDQQNDNDINNAPDDYTNMNANEESQQANQLQTINERNGGRGSPNSSAAHELQLERTEDQLRIIDNDVRAVDHSQEPISTNLKQNQPQTQELLQNQAVVVQTNEQNLSQNNGEQKNSDPNQKESAGRQKGNQQILNSLETHSRQAAQTGYNTVAQELEEEIQAKNDEQPSNLNQQKENSNLAIDKKKKDISELGGEYQLKQLVQNSGALLDENAQILKADMQTGGQESSSYYYQQQEAVFNFGNNDELNSNSKEMMQPMNSPQSKQEANGGGANTGQSRAMADERNKSAFAQFSTNAALNHSNSAKREKKVDLLAVNSAMAIHNDYAENNQNSPKVTKILQMSSENNNGALKANLNTKQPLNESSQIMGGGIRGDEPNKIEVMDVPPTMQQSLAQPPKIGPVSVKEHLIVGSEAESRFPQTKAQNSEQKSNELNS